MHPTIVGAVLQETYVKLQHELSLAEEKLRKAHSQGKLLVSDRKTLDKGIAKANNGIKVCFASTFVFMNPSRNHQGSFTVFYGKHTIVTSASESSVEGF